MSNKYEVLPPYPVFDRVPRRDKSIYIIILIILVIMIALACLILYNIYRNRDTIQITRCPAGLCVVNLSSGVKRCPNSLTEQLSYDQVFEDCSSSNYCQSDRAPCSVRAGGTLSCDGVCGAGNDNCNCAPRPV